MLSRREQVVLELLAEGLTYQESARRLHVSPHTISTQVGTILRKLKAKNAAHAVAIGYQNDLLMKHPPIRVVSLPAQAKLTA